MKEYNTVIKEVSTELIERKSRFISSVKPVNSESDAQGFIKEISEKYKDANHNVFAYVIGGDVEIQRASDDGEPQGTAGIPVLDVIKKEGLINVCIVVTRYFGGILLGAGGLIRAYSNSARMGLHEAGMCRMGLYSRMSAAINYTHLGKVQNSMAAMGNNIIKIEYTESVKLYIVVKHENIQKTVDSIREITYGEAVVEEEEVFYDVYNLLK